MIGILPHIVVDVPMTDYQHSRYESEDESFVLKLVERLVGHLGYPHDLFGRVDEAIIIGTHTKVVVEEPGFHAHVKELVAVDYPD